MKKKIITRSMIGMPIGVTISFLITIIISLVIRDGSYYPVVPELVTDFGNELNAVLVQTLGSLIIGVVFGGASAIWEAESWSPLRMTVTHALIVSLTTLPIAYFLRWMDHSVHGTLLYCGIFFGIYLAIWLWQYSVAKRRVRQMNEVLGK